jgi:hypothetical protein
VTRCAAAASICRMGPATGGALRKQGLIQIATVRQFLEEVPKKQTTKLILNGRNRLYGYAAA